MGLFIAIAVVVLLVGLYFAYDRKRYRGAGGVTRSRPTDEVFRDPGTGELMRVYYDPVTGAREYRAETPGEAGSPSKASR